MVRAGGPGVADRVDHQPGQVHRLVRDGAAGVQPGQQQQVVDQAGHPGALRLDPAQRVRHVGRHRLAAAAGQLGVAADRGQRGAQLVAGVGDELAYPGLAGLPGGSAADDVAEHPVERGADLADLGARVGVGVRHPLGSATSPRSSGSSETRVAVAATRRSGRRVSRTISAPAIPASSRPPAATAAMIIRQPGHRVLHAGQRQPGDRDVARPGARTARSR